MSYLYQFAAILKGSDVDKLPKDPLTTNTVANALQLVFGVSGGIAVVVVAYAGLTYVLSRGNPQETARAKNIILYAIVGLIICITAFSIIEFVIKRL
ncbi:MAG: rane protein [Candidatus Saccharibacteria bacterium]|nr:rane protein [Candidatus Saccharibacteria bacterium]